MSTRITQSNKTRQYSSTAPMRHGARSLCPRPVAAHSTSTETSRTRRGGCWGGIIRGRGGIIRGDACYLGMPRTAPRWLTGRRTNVSGGASGDELAKLVTFNNVFCSDEGFGCRSGFVRIASAHSDFFPFSVVRSRTGRSAEAVYSSLTAMGRTKKERKTTFSYSEVATAGKGRSRDVAEPTPLRTAFPSGKR